VFFTYIFCHYFMQVNGVDYKFVTRQEFSEMERSGVLLESGIYAGHYYGTPLPLAESLPPPGIQSPVHASSTQSAGPISPLTDKPSDFSTTGAKSPSQPSALALKRRRNRSNIAAIDAASLPHGWERISDAHYGVYYIDHINKRTQYERPYELELSKGPTGFGFTLVEVDTGLAVVKSILPGGAAFISGVIQPGDVLVSVSGVSVAGLQHSDIAKLFATFSPGDRVKLTFARGYALPPEVLADASTNASISNVTSHDFELISLTIVKGAQGFGFTIADGGPGVQRVKKILDTERCGPLRQGDILAIVNHIDLAALSHIQVVDVIKNHCQIGDATSFVVRRHKSGRPQPSNSERMRSKTPNADMCTGSDYARESYTLNTRNCKTPSAEMLRKQIAGWSASNASIAASQSNSNLHQQSNPTPPASSQAPPQPPPPPHYDQTNSAYAGYAMNGYANAGVALLGHDTLTTAASNTPIGANSYANGYSSDYTNTYANTGLGTGLSDPNYADNGDPEYQNQLYSNREALTQSAQYVDSYDNDAGVSYEQSANGDDFEYFRVCLQRGEAGFGFRIVGGAEESRPVTIGSIVISGVAHLDGILRAGDELISINERNVMNASHHHVVDLMAECGLTVSLLVRRRKFCDAFDVQLVRESNEGFGFVIISCGQCALIGRIIEQSPAARCQRLKIRDKIIAVNGIDITQMSHPEIVNMIKESGLMLRLRIVPADCYTVELIRGPKGFGFSIRGGAEFNGMPLFILRVAPDGPAWSLLNVGDEIIEINGMSTVDVTHSQAVLWISQSGPQVKLKLRKRELLSPSSASASGMMETSGTMMSLNSASSISAMAGAGVITNGNGSGGVGSTDMNPLTLQQQQQQQQQQQSVYATEPVANASNSASAANSFQPPTTYSAY
jgi:atrophin-1 interacting protein 3 (BAI1-associated protein 1)